MYDDDPVEQATIYGGHTRFCHVSEINTIHLAADISKGSCRVCNISEALRSNQYGMSQNPHIQRCLYTVPTFNSCIKCVGSPGIIYDYMPDFHPISWAWMHG